MSDFGSMSRESKKDKLRRQIVRPRSPHGTLIRKKTVKLWCARPTTGFYVTGGPW